MKKFFLNSAVITAEGVYSYHLIAPDEAKEWFSTPPYPISTIGYEETAQALSCLLGHEVPVNRTTIKMERGDEALVFRIVLPPGSPRIDPKDKGRIAQIVLAGQWELGLLKKIE